MRTLLGVGLALACGLAAAQDKKDDKKDEKIDPAKLVGRWESTGGGAGKGVGKTAVEYKSDGKMTLRRTGGKGGDFEVEGTYKLDGNTLTQTTTFNDMERTTKSTILKLTATELETESEKGTKTAYKRVRKID
ncbi:MAG: hypothetical protein C0501_27470 [Isosphaera sp.]|nr:hypothetical protein [Isosphaera sp.]